METFVSGDVVRLKSNSSPIMVVYGERDDEQVICCWFLNGKPQYHDFLKPMIEKCKPEQDIWASEFDSTEDED